VCCGRYANYSQRRRFLPLAGRGARGNLANAGLRPGEWGGKAPIGTVRGALGTGKTSDFWLKRWRTEREATWGREEFEARELQREVT